MENNKVKTALISVYDKSNLEFLGKELEEMGVSIYSTGGTLRFLREKKIKAKSISTITNFPEIFDGRIKTLHPKLHGGILGLRHKEIHVREAISHNILWIDLLVVNLYPFEETMLRPLVVEEEVIENIDIGGPAMMRSGAKNYQYITVVFDPKDYQMIIHEMKENNGSTLLESRKKLARKVFLETSHYDSLIADYLGETKKSFPNEMTLKLTRSMTMKYGENPHQSAATYSVKSSNKKIGGHDAFEKIYGDDLSYNNLLDIASSINLINEFENNLPTVAITKHTNPCGVASRSNLSDAFKSAFSSDTQSPFGGIVVANCTIDLATATAIDTVFNEVVISPDYHDQALNFLMKRKRRRIIRMKKCIKAAPIELRSILGNILMQESDTNKLTEESLQVVTKRTPSKDEIEDLFFAWKVCKHVKSNSIVYVKNKLTVGIGAGQMSRIDATNLAIKRAKIFDQPLAGSVVASDAFFPFSDGVLAAAEAGATAIIQPGGSIRDNEVINAANDKNIAMVFTSVRCLKH